MPKRKTHEQFIEELFEVNPNIEILSKYIGSLTKIKCRCKIDNHIWYTIPNNLLCGHGCPACALNNAWNSRRKTHSEFIDELKLINNDVEILSEYTGTHNKVKCRCKIDGYIWFTTPHRLTTQKYGCPKCSFSKGENKICSILKELNIDYIEQYRFNDCRNQRPLPFDFYLPSYNICIEYQGGQHYFSVEYFGGQNKFKEQQKKDKIKKEYCQNNGINLIEIPYWEFDNIEEILKEKLHSEEVS